MSQYDYIVIGGGSAGSAVAGRLAVDGTRSVCLVEAGGRNNNLLVKTPGFMPFLLKNTNYRYDTVPQKGLNGRIATSLAARTGRVERDQCDGLYPRQPLGL